MTDLGRPRRPWDRTPPEEREYFDLLGPGVVGVLPPRADSSSERGWSPPHGGAWVHIGESGTVRAFTGKVEVGQGSRLALTRVVAEALDVPVERVELTMGDTDLCPWDMGTFGSRSMPDAAPALFAAATAARDALRDPEARGGSARSSRGTKDETSVPGSLGESGPTPAVHRSIVRTAKPPDAGILTPPFRRAAAASEDPVGRGVVTGRQRFGSDISRVALLHGAVLWPPVHGATLLEADTAAAETLPGVTIVRDTGFLGAVAERPTVARAALATVQVRWQRPDYPAEREVEAYLRSNPLSGDEWDREEDRVGDVEAGLRGAAHRVEATYRTAYIAHVPLEPRCAVAEWSGSRLTVWVGTQTPFRTRATVARALGASEDDVRIIVPPTGAGFGGKHGGDIATAAARLARGAGRPVRLAFSREEEFRFAYVRPLSVMDVRAGVDDTGRLTAWSFHNLNGGAAAAATPYAVPHRRIWNTLAASPLAQGSYRALAATANNFARESAIDELAVAARADPLELRRRHLDDPRLRTVLDRAAERAAWSSRTRVEGRGFGMALGREKGSRIATVAEVRVDSERRLTVRRLVSAFEAGAIVHPANLRSQVEGAHVMALGGALFEAVHVDHGEVQNPRLSQYRVPRFSDVPEIDVELVDARAFPPAGGGETPMITVAPAIANAIFDATGTRLRALPLVPTGRVPR